METKYNFNFVVLSIAVAILASYVALELATAVTHAKGRARAVWLIAGALAMGFGIWSMHFIGMLAFEMPGMYLSYDIGLVILSILVAVSASALSLYIISRPAVNTKTVVGGGCAMAAAIAGMHYIGMFSMRMAAKIQWNIPLVVLSVVIALIASFLALLAAIRIRDTADHRRQQTLASFIMGLAISGMHYTGMIAATFVQDNMPAYQSSDVLATDGLAIAILVVTIFILGLALVGSTIDRMFALKTVRVEKTTQLYIEAERAAKELRKEREIRERFVSALAHDLRTPLAAAKMGAQLGIDEATDPAAVEMLCGKVVESLDRMEQMIEDLLDAHRISAGQPLPLQIEKCRVAPFFQNILEDLKTVYGARFILKCDFDLEANWDAKYIRRAVENLCTNAVKYGRTQTYITISVDVLNRSLFQIRVHNEGEPLNQEESLRLFSLFSRGQSAEKRGKGWGVGLTIVRGVVNAHHGTVRVESSPENGTSFILELPSNLA